MLETAQSLTSPGADEAPDGGHVVFRVGDMRNVTRGREDVEFRSTQGSGDLIHDRSKHRWAQRSLGQQRRLREAGKAAEVDGKLVRVVGFVEERRSIHDHDLLSFRRKLCPGARAECHGLHELLGGAGVIARDDPVHDRGDPIAHRPEQGLHLAVACEQREQRRFVYDDPTQEVRALRGQPERDRAAERVPRDPCRSEPQVLDERSEVRHVVVNAPLTFRPLAGAVAAAVERQDPEDFASSGTTSRQVSCELHEPCTRTRGISRDPLIS